MEAEVGFCRSVVSNLDGIKIGIGEVTMQDITTSAPASCAGFFF